jgi:hypothetical protein
MLKIQTCIATTFVFALTAATTGAGGVLSGKISGGKGAAVVYIEAIPGKTFPAPAWLWTSIRFCSCQYSMLLIDTVPVNGSIKGLAGRRKFETCPGWGASSFLPQPVAYSVDGGINCSGW